jgi:hypothetical protein
MARKLKKAKRLTSARTKKGTNKAKSAKRAKAKKRTPKPAPTPQTPSPPTPAPPTPAPPTPGGMTEGHTAPSKHRAADYPDERAKALLPMGDRRENRRPKFNRSRVCKSSFH